MIISHFVRTTNDRDGNQRRGWLVYHVRGDKTTYLGFIVYMQFPNWSQIKSALPGIVNLSSIETTPSQYSDLLSERAESPEYLQRIADAIDGS